MDYSILDRELARVLWLLKNKIYDISNVNVRTIQDLCNEFAGVSSFSPEPQIALSFLVDNNLVVNKNSKLFFSKMGLELIKQTDNPNRLNRNQINIISDVIFSNINYIKQIRILLSNLYLSEDIYYLPNNIIDNLDEKTLDILYLLQELSLITWDGNNFTISYEKILKLLPDLLSDAAMSTDTLESMLDFQKKMGKKAESFILEWEKKRLKNIGYSSMLPFVKSISTDNVNAGYDIESVDGGEQADNERYIEVKSSTGLNPVFYWSANEIACARKYRKSYWIYFVPYAHRLPTSKPEVILIRDPVKYLGNLLVFSENVLKVWMESKHITSIKTTYNFGEEWQGKLLR
jgi:hypothetical protein